MSLQFVVCSEMSDDSQEGDENEWVSFGVSYKDGRVIDAIQEPLQWEDSRSERIRNLSRDGLAVERAFRAAGVDDETDFRPAVEGFGPGDDERLAREAWLEDVVTEALRDLFGGREHDDTAAIN